MEDGSSKFKIEEDGRNLVDEYKGLSNELVKKNMDEKRAEMARRVFGGGEDAWLEVAIENVGHDFNMGTIVRNANNFNVGRVHIVGRRKYNRRGAMCTDKYLNIDYWKSVQEFLDNQKKRGREVVVIENNVEGARPLASKRFVREGERGVGVRAVGSDMGDKSCAGAMDDVEDKSCAEMRAVDGAEDESCVEMSKKFVRPVTLVFGSEGEGLSAEMLAGASDVRYIESFGSTRSVNVGVASGIAMYEWARQVILEGEHE